MAETTEVVSLKHQSRFWYMIIESLQVKEYAITPFVQRYLMTFILDCVKEDYSDITE